MTEGILDLTSFLLGGATGAAQAAAEYVALAYPIEYPSVSGIREINWSVDQVRGISECPYTLHRKVFPHPGERLRAQVILPPMSKANLDEWSAFLLLLDGGYGTFLFGDVFKTSPRGLVSGSPQVYNGGQTGKVLNISGMNPSVTGQFKAFDWIQVGYNLHAVLRDANSDENGICTLDIFPRLRESPADAQAVITANTKGTFQLAKGSGNLRKLGISGIGEITASFEVIEAF